MRGPGLSGGGPVRSAAAVPDLRQVGFHFPQFPSIALSRGWGAEDKERNLEVVEKSADLREGARQLVTRAFGMATLSPGAGAGESSTPRGGRKASPVRTPLQACRGVPRAQIVCRRPQSG
jgi:hypothetical protein